MRLDEIASAGGTAAGAITTVSGQQGATQKRNIYGDITLEDLEFNGDTEPRFITRALRREILPYARGGHPEAQYLDMLNHVLIPSKNHEGHHPHQYITASEFKKLLGHQRLNTETSNDFPGLDVSKLLQHTLGNTRFAGLLAGLDENVEGMIQRR